jgi:hypothetical protein
MDKNDIQKMLLAAEGNRKPIKVILENGVIVPGHVLSVTQDKKWSMEHFPSGNLQIVDENKIIDVEWMGEPKSS